MTGAPRRATARRGAVGLLVLLLAGSGLAGCTDDEPAAPDLSSTTSSVGDSDVSCGEGVQALVEGGAAVEFTTTTLTLQPAEGDPVEGCYLVADTIEERSRGLMATTDLGEYAGMVFVFEADANGGFYMKDTLIPLSIAWFTAAGEFVSSADMEPCPDELAAQDECPTYAASGEYRYAIEVPQGDLEAVGIDGLGSSLETG